MLKECNIIQAEEKLILLTNKLEGKIIVLENPKLKAEIDIKEELTSKNKLTLSDFKKNTDHIKIKNIILFKNLNHKTKALIFSY